MATYVNDLDCGSLNGMGQLVVSQIDNQVRMIDMAMNTLVDSMNTDTQILVESAEKMCESVAAIFE